MRRGNRIAAVAVGTIALAGLLSACDTWSTITVTSTADAVDAAIGNGVCATAGGECTLRAAVQEANAQTGPITIELADDESYVLSIGGAPEAAAASGDLDITAKVAIEGHGSTIDAAGIDRVLEVRPAAELSLRHVTVTGGYAMLGGGVRVDASASARISDSIVNGNEAWGTRSCFASATGSGCSTETTTGPFGTVVGEGGGAGLWNAGTLRSLRTHSI